MEPTAESPSRRSRGRAVLAGFALALVWGVVLSRFVCVDAFIRRGVLIRRCPDGRIRQTLYAECSGLYRGGDGVVRVGATAHYTTSEADEHLTAPVRRLSARLMLEEAGGRQVPLAPNRDGWKRDGDFARRAVVALPKDLPDGDHTLVVSVRSPLGDETLRVPLPVYAPARVHVITDRPLYEPEHNVQFRAVVLRATDFAPIDGRPGRWVVQDPSGETVLEEKAPAGRFGVVAGSFPLDAGAPTGAWRVRWLSGGAEDGVSFTVAPFTLPRFRLEATAGRPFYRAGERPVLRGRVLYSAGPPVAGAAVELQWTVDGAWPAPTSWQEGALPTRATTDGSGAFEVRLPVVPADLRGKATLRARLAATDPAGDRAEGGAQVLLAEDPIAVTAVTELGDRLVQGFNNRLFLRATTAAGEVLARTELQVRRAWEPNDPGLQALTDEDGVAALQVDPGPPVNVVVPPMPVRPPAPAPPVSRGATRDVLTGLPPSLADQRALDRLHPTLAACAAFVEETAAEATVAARVDAAGAVGSTAHDGTPLGGCLAGRLAGVRLAPGKDRLYSMTYALISTLPHLEVAVDGVPGAPAPLAQALNVAALEARSCLPAASGAAAFPRVLLWQATAGKKGVSISFAPDPRKAEHLVPAAVSACVEKHLLATTWPSLEPPGDVKVAARPPRALGVARFTVRPAAGSEEAHPQATTLVAYELAVTARGPSGGSTKVVLRPGEVPPIRLRASPVLAQPGTTVEVTVLRGPTFSGKLPAKLVLSNPRASLESDLDEKTRTARYTLPADARGWFEAAWGGGRALVYVRPPGELAVSIQPAAPRVRPGETAELVLKTTAAGQGTQAAVGLFGVDASLAQLAPLPGPDDLARVRPRPTMAGPAFGVLDVSALEMGRIRGANAASATVLRVTTLPPPGVLDATVYASLRPDFDPLEPLTDTFYNVLGELQARVRAWETSAPRTEQMRPPTMARLWSAALAECEKRKEPVTDAYGRRLELRRLPQDLLALTDPRAVVVNGTRLPEDVESWPAWVAREQP